MPVIAIIGAGPGLGQGIRREPLARFTTMRVGGPADLFATVYNLFELRGLVRFARARELPVFLLGWTGDYGDADNFVGTFFQTPGAQFGTITGDAVARLQVTAAAVTHERGVYRRQFRAPKR